MKKYICLFTICFILAPLTYAGADAGYADARKYIIEKRIPFWEAQLEKVVGEKVVMSIDFDSYPKTAKALKRNLDFDVLSRIRGSFRAATSKNKNLLKGKILKVQVKHDGKSNKSSFQYDKVSKTLKVNTSSGEKWWIDAERLVSLLESL